MICACDLEQSWTGTGRQVKISVSRLFVNSVSSGLDGRAWLVESAVQCARRARGQWSGPADCDVTGACIKIHFSHNQSPQSAPYPVCKARLSLARLPESTTTSIPRELIMIYTLTNIFTRKRTGWLRFYIVVSDWPVSLYSALVYFFKHIRQSVWS